MRTAARRLSACFHPSQNAVNEPLLSGETIHRPTQSGSVPFLPNRRGNRVVGELPGQHQAIDQSADLFKTYRLNNLAAVDSSAFEAGLDVLDRCSQRYSLKADRAKTISNVLQAAFHTSGAAGLAEAIAQLQPWIDGWRGLNVGFDPHSKRLAQFISTQPDERDRLLANLMKAEHAAGRPVNQQIDALFSTGEPKQLADDVKQLIKIGIIDPHVAASAWVEGGNTEPLLHLLSKQLVNQSSTDPTSMPAQLVALLKSTGQPIDLLKAVDAQGRTLLYADAQQGDGSMTRALCEAGFTTVDTLNAKGIGYIMCLQAQRSSNEAALASFKNLGIKDTHVYPKLLEEALNQGYIGPAKSQDRPLQHDRLAGRVRYDTLAGINDQHEDGFSVLHWAAANGDLAAIEKCIQRGAFINLTRKNSGHLLSTPLYDLAYERWVQKKGKIDLTQTNNVELDDTPLFDAASRGQLRAIKTLVDAGANVRGVSSPVFGAAQRGLMDVLLYWVDQLKLKLVEDSIYHPLVGAIRGLSTAENIAEVINFLLETSPKPSQQAVGYALNEAIRCNHTEERVFDQLISTYKRLDPNIPRPLDVKRKCSKFERGALLFEGSATPLCYAVAVNNQAAIRRLLKHGATVDQQGCAVKILKYYSTKFRSDPYHEADGYDGYYHPLDLAARLGYVDALQCLWEDEGLSDEAKGLAKEQLIQTAQQHNHRDVIVYLQNWQPANSVT